MVGFLSKSGNSLFKTSYFLIFPKMESFSLDQAKNIGQFDITIHTERNKHIFKEDYKNIGNISTFYKYMSELQSKKALGFKQDFIFLKTHSGLFEIDGSPFTNQQNTRGIIYILRDPRMFVFHIVSTAVYLLISVLIL